MLDQSQLQELLVQSLEHEQGGVKIYEAALRSVVSDDLRNEWSKYLDQTREHAKILERALQLLEIDPEQESPGRAIVRGLGASFAKAIDSARQTLSPSAAQIVACECVVLAETKDHANWELLTKCAEQLGGSQRDALREACAMVEDQEDEHLYHSKGYCRELWLESLGLPSMLPPPEEEQHVKTAIAAARAQQESERERDL